MLGIQLNETPGTNQSKHGITEGGPAPHCLRLHDWRWFLSGHSNIATTPLLYKDASISP